MTLQPIKTQLADGPFSHSILILNNRSTCFTCNLLSGEWSVLVEQSKDALSMFCYLNSYFSSTSLSHFYYVNAGLMSALVHSDAHIHIVYTYWMEPVEEVPRVLQQLMKNTHQSQLPRSWILTLQHCKVVIVFGQSPKPVKCHSWRCVISSPIKQNCHPVMHPRAVWDSNRPLDYSQTHS